MEKTVNLNPGEDPSSKKQKHNSICAQENPTIVTFAVDMKDNVLQAPDFKEDRDLSCSWKDQDGGQR